MPRKTRQAHGAVPLRRRASMRPRPDATENPQPGVARPLVPAASMRPRPDATENAAGEPALTVRIETLQ